MNKLVKTSDLYGEIPVYLAELFDESEYPWQILPKISGTIKQLLQKGIEGYTLLREGVLVGKNVKIYPTATIEPPCVIGHGTEIRPGAFIRGNVIIGDGCVVGNSTELKNCVLLDKVQAPHYNYVGDSVLGYKSHTGAGVICSNLKSDGNNVVIHADKEHFTGLRKVGAFLGDGADIGCGTVMNPGTVVGKNTRVYPLSNLRGVYPSDSIVKNSGEPVIKNHTNRNDILL